MKELEKILIKIRLTQIENTESNLTLTKEEWMVIEKAIMNIRDWETLMNIWTRMRQQEESDLT